MPASKNVPIYLAAGMVALVLGLVLVIKLAIG
jgi:hypothetical protein